MSIQIIRSGVLDTIQDNGRYGFAKWGINPGGAMDRYATQVANALAGNDLNDGVFEIHFPGCQILFLQNVLISLTGADFKPHINAVPVPLWKPLEVGKDSILSFHEKRKGTRCYLAIHGGLKLHSWLGSVSTSIKTMTGGINGLPLKKGDVIALRPSTYNVNPSRAIDVNGLPWQVNDWVYSNKDISFIEGNEWHWLTKESQQNLMSGEFMVDPSSDRMGFHLKHEPLLFQHYQELLSSAVSFGTLQALPNGQLIALMADHQTTGGYPRIGHVIGAHLPKLAQLGAKDVFHLKKISLEASEKELFSLRQDLLTLQESCRKNLQQYYA